MTDRRQGIPVAGIAVAVFCVLLIYLALQMRAGSDPAIGAGEQSAAAEAPRRVLVRRIIVTRVVEEDDAPAADGPTPAARTQAASAPSAAQPPAAAPAVPATATPAPVVSRGS
jgi:hypothetical protein